MVNEKNETGNSYVDYLVETGRFPRTPGKPEEKESNLRKPDSAKRKLNAMFWILVALITFFLWWGKW